MRRLIPSGYLWVLLGQMALAASSVTSVATTQATALPLDGEGSAIERILKVADVTVTSDAPTGFTLTVTSGSLSKTDAQDPIPFQVVAVPMGAPAPTAADFTSAPGESHFFSTNAQGNAALQLYIRYKAAPLQDPGTYTASLVVSVLDN